jgi:DNA polymerase III epsilon subunit-like protein
MIDAGYVSVDVETSGPNPAGYSLLSIGACLVADLGRTFYVELQPIPGLGVIPEALEIGGLSLEHLAQHGLPPAEGLARFAGWLEEAVPAGMNPVFVGFNAPFDWMFVNDYFHRFLGRNPFGHGALDIRSFFMGLTGAEWYKAGLRHVADRYGITHPLTHHALHDARDQAVLLLKMLDEQSAAMS